MQTAIRAAQLACEKIFDLWGNPRKIAEFKKADGDTPVTVIDLQSSAAIRGMLKKYRPDDSINDEDGESKKGKSGITWWIDPLDGTSNCLSGFTDSVVGVAAFENGQPIVAAIGHPFKKEIYYAEAGRGVWKVSLSKLNSLDFEHYEDDGDPIKVNSNPCSWKERFLLIDSLFNSRTYLPKITFLSASSNPTNPFGAMNVRSFGSNILYGALVASGQAQVSLTDAVGGFWDIAPTILLVKEAGGDVFDINGETPQPGCQVFLATNGQYKTELLNALQESYRGYQGFR